MNLEELGFLDFELDNILGEETNIDEFFEDKIESKKEKKKVVCPECGHEFTP